MLTAKTISSEKAISISASSRSSGRDQATITPWENHTSASTPAQNAGFWPPFHPSAASNSGGR
jgi:hypothetical protein